MQGWPFVTWELYLNACGCLIQLSERGWKDEFGFDHDNEQQ